MTFLLKFSLNVKPVLNSFFLFDQGHNFIDFEPKIFLILKIYFYFHVHIKVCLIIIINTDETINNTFLFYTSNFICTYKK